jgi:hypothetical protein
MSNPRLSSSDIPSREVKEALNKQARFAIRQFKRSLRYRAEPEFNMAAARRANRQAEERDPALKAKMDAGRKKFAELKHANPAKARSAEKKEK